MQIPQAAALRNDFKTFRPPYPLRRPVKESLHSEPPEAAG